MKIEEISERLTEVRKELGITQKEMAKKAGCSLGAWQAYESGTSVPGGKVLASIAEQGININWLLTGKGEMSLSGTLSDFDRMLVWNVAYFMSKRSDSNTVYSHSKEHYGKIEEVPAVDPEQYADNFLHIYETLYADAPKRRHLYNSEMAPDIEITFEKPTRSKNDD